MVTEQTENQKSENTEKSDKKQTAGVYVYGIVPADVEPRDDATGVADGKVDIVTDGDIAALVSAMSVDRPLGKPEDLRAHANVLDGTAGVAPVLPLRFGAVLTYADAVKEELLSAHADEFAAALEQLEGKAQYVVKADMWSRRSCGRSSTRTSRRRSCVRRSGTSRRTPAAMRGWRSGNW